MRKIIIAIICITFVSTVSIAQKKLNINTSKSSIKWIGEYTFYFGGHDGNIKFKEGYFIKTGELISGGEFIIDMTSITNNDIKAKKANEGLVNHLKEPEFFDVKKYPIAKLVITKVDYFEDKSMRFKADLTIKGITESIRFNATPNYDEKSLSTKFKIDRTRWNVSYKSKIKNSAISDGIGFEILLKL